MVNPLRGMDNLTTEQWFAHGAKGYPPKDGEFLELPAGGKATFELACNRALTTYRDPTLTRPLPVYACDVSTLRPVQFGAPDQRETGRRSPAQLAYHLHHLYPHRHLQSTQLELELTCQNDKGPLHNANNFGAPLNRSLFGGTALAIAYTSDVENLKPNNMTIISVNLTSPWTREVTYWIPADLPPCPKGGCLVTWNWVHLTLQKEGYGAEIVSSGCVRSDRSWWEDGKTGRRECGATFDQPLTFSTTRSTAPKSRARRTRRTPWGQALCP